MEDFLELRFELSSLENASMWRKNWGLSEACGGGQGNPHPTPTPATLLPFTFLAGKKHLPSLLLML